MKKLYSFILSNSNSTPVADNSFLCSKKQNSMKKMFWTGLIVLAILIISFQNAFAQTTTTATNAGTGTNLAGVGNVPWTSPGNIATTNATDRATATLNNTISNYLEGIGYGFTIPTDATILGIQLAIGKVRQSGQGNTMYDNQVVLIKNGSVVGSNYANTTAWSRDQGSPVETVYGGSSDLWGSTWTPAQINSPNFGAAISAKTTGSRIDAYVYYIRIAVTYLPAPASEPTTQASNVTFSSVTVTGMTLNFTPGNGSNRIVLVKQGSAVNNDPIDMTSYTANTTFGTGFQIGAGNYVVYNGTGNNVTITGLSSSSTYYVAVYEFNGTGGAQNYMITNPAVGNQATPLASGEYRSTGSGNWNSASTWQTYNGTTWIPAINAPTSTIGKITIRSGHIVAVVSNVAVDQVTVDAGGQVNVGNATMTIADGIGDDFTVNGTLSINNRNGAITPNGNLRVNSGGTYIHARNGGGIPVATWDVASNCIVTGVNTTIPNPASFAQSFGNFIWNCAGQTGNLSLAANMVSINSDFTITSTGSGSLRLCNSLGNSSITTIVAGNFIQMGGTFYVYGSGANNIGNTMTLAVQGDFSLTSGTFNLNGGSETPVTNAVLNIAGDFTVGSGTTLTETGSGTANIYFTGASMQTYTSGGTVNNTVNFTVNNGAYLQMAAAGTTVAGAGTFTLLSGGTLGITSPEGIAAIGTASGNIQTTISRAFNTGANYIYNGSAAQNTGNGLPATVSNLTFNNSGGTVTLNSARAITNNFSITPGSVANLNTFNHAAGTLTLGGLGTASGTFGSNSSSATNKNNIYFAPGSIGVVTVGTGTCIALSAPGAGSNSKTYNGAANATTLSATPGTGETIDWYTASTGGTKVATGSTTYTPVAVNAGTYTYYAEARNTITGCVSAGRTAVSLTITKATPTLSVTNSPVTYTGAGQAATVTSSVPGTVSNILTGGAATQINVGTYTVTANFIPTDIANYNNLTTASAGNFIITKATPTLSVTNSPVTYTGAGQAATVTSSVPGTVSNILTGGAATQINVGTYNVTANFIPTDIANYNNLTTASAGNFIITKATPTLSVTNSPVTYTGAGQSASVSGSVPGVASSILTGGSATQVNVGTYAVTANFIPTDVTNYNSLTAASAGNFVINPATSTTWTGTVNNSWTDPGNWSPVLPGLGISVTIPAVTNKPVISTSGNECADLTLAAGAVLTIAYNGNLTVNGSLNNAGAATDLVIQSISSGTGSLITKGTVTGTATVQRYIGGISWGWHFLSSPVTAQPVSGGFTPSGTGNGYDFYTWYEPTLTWVNFKNTTIAPTWNTANGNTNFLPGRGYLVAYEAINTTKNFTGLLNTGTVSYLLTKGGNTTYKYFNLVGNPYPCSIDWDAATGWDRSKLDGDQKSYWVWNDARGNYGAYITGGSGTLGATRYISSGQGFIVLAATAGNFTMDNSVKAHSAQAYLKSEESGNGELRLSLSSDVNAYSDEAIVRLDNSIIDPGSEKFNSMYTNAPELWSVKNGINYSINRLGDMNAGESVPLTVKAGVAGNYTLTASQVESFGGYSNVFLEDRTAGSFTSFSATPIYKFIVSEPATIVGRFYLHFQDFTGVSQSEVIKDFNAYAADGIMNIQSLQQQSGKIAIFDMLGRTIATGRLEAGATTRINMLGNTGVYIVSVLTSKGISNTKILVK
jgi:hypothetical protein